MGALSPWHVILIALVALLLFGPNKLPELGRGFGKMLREFKDVTTGKDAEMTQPASQLGEQPQILTTQAAAQRLSHSGEGTGARNE
jgi:sec-independent protein translocase protein TatA